MQLFLFHFKTKTKKHNRPWKVLRQNLMFSLCSSVSTGQSSR